MSDRLADVHTLLQERFPQIAWNREYVSGIGDFQLVGATANVAFVVALDGPDFYVGSHELLTLEPIAAEFPRDAAGVAAFVGQSKNK